MNYTNPEKAGIESKNIVKFISELEEKRLATHSIILAKGDNVFYEAYWSPFDEKFLHRMYSVSKSFVSIAICFLAQDGLVDLDDTMDKYFAAELINQPDKNMHKQSIRHMLMMETAKTSRYWFNHKPQDRVAYYFENDNTDSRPSGTIFQYDSDGSFVLGALVERVTHKTLMDYLREKLFDIIGVSKEAYCLKCPGGHSWGDSGIMCRPTDLLKVARFVMNKGSFNGKQILEKKYIDMAVNCKVFNNYSDTCAYDTHGYGFQFWGTYDDAFSMLGMGSQLAICVPQKDLILIYNADNQGKGYSDQYILDAFFKYIVNTASDKKISINKEGVRKLESLTNRLELISASGVKYNDFEREINGVTYGLAENVMGISQFKLTFFEESGIFEYVNKQGKKSIEFGRCKNIFSYFPEEGYSDEIGTFVSEGHKYKCAASMSWVEDKKIHIRVQIIDKYFGNLSITIGFRDDVCGLYMEKNAEDFLKEYQGYASGKKTI